MELARRIVAVLIALRALPNLGKPFNPAAGFVVLGRLRHGWASTVVGPIFGVLMLVYAVGLWRARPWARPVAIAYAVWATVNVVLFPFLEGVPARFAPAMYLVFAVPGIVVPWLAVWLLGRR
jgi:hypothetical protein